MRQHQDPGDYEDEEDLEELGTPVYEGSGLSVRALTADELQHFLDAHTGQPAQPLGSGWAGLDPPEHPDGVPWTPPAAAPAPPDPSRRSQPSRAPAASAARGARPSPSIGAAARSWPPGPAA
jgi:hypothetical protein